jgi:hypothetical protein
LFELFLSVCNPFLAISRIMEKMDGIWLPLIISIPPRPFDELPEKRRIIQTRFAFLPPCHAPIYSKR